MSEPQSGGPCETPLVDLLRGVPSDARMVYESVSAAHLIPVGSLCARAAAEIEALRVERDAALVRVERLEDALQLVLPMAKGYAYAHDVGRNAEMCTQAESVLRAALERREGGV